MLPNTYLVCRWLKIISLSFEGLSRVEIERNLSTKRQAVYDLEGIVLEKVEEVPMHAVKSNMMEDQLVDASKGALIGCSPPTIITFSAKNGLQTQSLQQLDCAQRILVERCSSRLPQEAEERNILLTSEEKASAPPKQAQVTFSHIIPELKP